MPAPVAALHSAIAGSDAVLIASPEYAHGVTGVLKNALDWLVASLTFTDQHYKAIAEFMAPQGKFGLIDDPPEFNVSAFKGKAISIHWESMFTRSSFQTPDMIGQHMLLNDVADLIDKGVLRTTLDQTFGTINAANLKRAHALLESGKSRGKIVLEGW